MKPAMPAPTKSRISSALAAAMMPRRRLVVPRFGSIVCASERRRLTRRLIARRLMVADRVVEEFPAFARGGCCLSCRHAKAVELPRDVIDGRLDLAPYCAA